MQRFISAQRISGWVDYFSNIVCRGVHIVLVVVFIILITTLVYSGFGIIFQIRQTYLMVTFSIIGIWLVYNIIFNYVMASFVHGGSPFDLPSSKLQNISYKCKKCFTIKPPRTHHCSMCDQCILQMDHHCPWLGTCIGHHNRRFFVNFLSYACAGSAYIVYLVWLTDQFNQLTQVCIFAFSISLALGLFGGYHWALVLTGRTTLQTCFKDPRYTPKSDMCLNFEIVFGTRNLLVALMPLGDRLQVVKYQWQIMLPKSENQRFVNEIQINDIVN